MTADSGQDGPLDLAARRLERALAMLEQRIQRRVADASAQSDGAVDQDRSQLAAALDTARARERELESAGEAASVALSRAISEIRAVLGAH